MNLTVIRIRLVDTLGVKQAGGRLQRGVRVRRREGKRERGGAYEIKGGTGSAIAAFSLPQKSPNEHLPDSFPLPLASLINTRCKPAAMRMQPKSSHMYHLCSGLLIFFPLYACSHVAVMRLENRGAA